ncbi:metallophosphoesterase [Olivibacter sp. SDN3]|uniref:metallophosphoesterase n=1 Tax=Olivibacter sp. SDN3 TaxID=2764720 RepID=UPI0016516957|nr:metallophosphoesterase [Olivibacter sp. SDN3]QNL51049.1 metallophosphoesterase [Olivibacter sp. SDN3]
MNKRKLRKVCTLLLIAVSCTTIQLFAQDTSKRTFSIAVIPDTQYNTEESQGGTNRLFETMIEWVLANREKENIVYLAHLGDITDKGDRKPEQWANAAKAMHQLEKPLPRLPHGLPYGMAVGNHDQYPSQFARSGETFYYNKYFGVDHFQGRDYYGGHFGDDNDSHYDLISAGGLDLLVIYIEFDAFDEQQDAMNDWAVDLLEKYPDRKAIIVSHYIIGYNPIAGSNVAGQAAFGKQGQRLYDRIKTQPNVFLMLCGHVGDNGEGYRQDTYAGHTTKTMLSDYQSRPMGGNGLMRLLTFDLEKDVLRVRTFSPYHDLEENDDDSHFSVPLFREVAASRTFDIDLDGKSKPLSFKHGNWFGIDGIIASLGRKGDIPVPSYYNSYGKTSPAVYNPTTASFYLNDWKAISLGKTGDIPVPADYDGDGIADIAVWNPHTAEWLVDGCEPVKHGWEASVPVPADYDGDGVAEMAVWRLNNKTWYIATVGNVPFGEEGDVPVPADYDGDGKVDMAVWRPSTGEWLVYGKKGSVKLGKKGDLPIPGDYNGVGKAQPAIFDPVAKQITFADGQRVNFDANLEEIVNLPYAIKQYYLELLNK